MTFLPEVLPRMSGLELVGSLIHVSVPSCVVQHWVGIYSVLHVTRLPVPFDMLYVDLVSEKGEVCPSQKTSQGLTLDGTGAVSHHE